MRIKLPKKTFWDPEDGNTRNLTVDIYNDDFQPFTIPWLRYDPKIQTLYALPYDDNDIGYYKLKIVATDSKGCNVTDDLGKHFLSVYLHSSHSS